MYVFNSYISEFNQIIDCFITFNKVIEAIEVKDNMV